MTPRSLARKYAAALYEIAARNQQVEPARRDLGAFAELVASHQELQQSLATPLVPTAQKRAMLTALLDRAGIQAVEVRRMLLLLADQERLALIGDVAEAFMDRCREADRVVQAEVTSAVPLSDAERTAVSVALGRAVGRTVLLTEKIDPAIIGGVVAKVGGVVFDGSVGRQIERLREKLLTDARS